MNTKIALHHFILTLAALAVMFLPMGQGDFFGSEGDWYSQHVGAAQALRQTIIDLSLIHICFLAEGVYKDLHQTDTLGKKAVP